MDSEFFADLDFLTGAIVVDVLCRVMNVKVYQALSSKGAGDGQNKLNVALWPKRRGEFRRELTELYIRGTSSAVDLIPLSDGSIDLTWTWWLDGL